MDYNYSIMNYRINGLCKLTLIKSYILKPVTYLWSFLMLFLYVSVSSKFLKHGRDVNTTILQFVNEWV